MGTFDFDTFPKDCARDQAWVDRVAGPSGKLIMTSFNMGYLDFGHNWIHGLQRLGITNFVVHAEDPHTFWLLELLVPGHVVCTSVEVERKAGTYNSALFNKMAKKRPDYILYGLEHGKDVLWVDADIAFVKNPLEWIDKNAALADLSLAVGGGVDSLDDVDMLIAVEGGELEASMTAAKFQQSPMCTGFIFSKATDASVELFRHWRAVLSPPTPAGQAEGKGGGKPKPNQYSWNTMMRSSKVLKELNHRRIILKQDWFPPGKFMQNKMEPEWRQKHKDEVVIVHANFLQGRQSKQKALDQWGHWNVHLAFQTPKPA